MSPHARDPLRIWLLRLSCWLIALYGVWWGLSGAEWTLRGLRYIADIALPHLFSQGVTGIVLLPDQVWKVRTGLTVVGTNHTELGIFFLNKALLARIVVGFPMLWSLILATDGLKPTRLLFATTLLWVVVLLAITGYLWAMLPVLINHEKSLILDHLIPPPFQVYGVPYPPWLFHLSVFAHYISLIAVPIIAPLLVWVLVCSRSIRRLLVALRWSRRSAQSQVLNRVSDAVPR